MHRTTQTGDSWTIDTQPAPQSHPSAESDLEPIPVPKTSTEAHLLLVQSLALLGQVMCIAVLGLWLIEMTLSTPADGLQLQDLVSFSSVLYLGAVAMSALLWFGAARGLFGVLATKTLDAGFLPYCVAALCGATFYAPEIGRSLSPELSATLIAVSAMLLRAAFVPSRLWKTIAVSSATAVPPMLVATRAEAVAASPLWLSYPVFWLGVGIALSAVVSETIHRLRAVARYALALGQYKLRQRIGKGGMGEVYFAEHGSLRRPTAVKLIRADRVTLAYMERFEAEARMMARLTHPNTVTIYDYGKTSGGMFYIAMEYLSGIDMEILIDEWGPQPAGRVARFMAQACGSLAEAHQSGLVHRDLKPGNLMVVQRPAQREIIKVLDFGLARGEGEDALQLNAAGALIGTPDYMAPECLTGEKLDGRTDLYMLGAVSYHLLAGHPPFQKRTLAQVCAAHLHETPEPPSASLAQPVPPELEALVMACLAKDRNERPGSALALKRSFELCDVPPWTEEAEREFWESATKRQPMARRESRGSTLKVSQFWH